jgi:cytochrome c553
MNKGIVLGLLVLILAADWSRDARVELGHDRRNIYNLSNTDFHSTRERGLVHAVHYPVTVTGLLVPYEPLADFLEGDARHPLRRLIARLASAQLGYSSLDEMYEWLGLNSFNEPDATGIYRIPYPPSSQGMKPDFPMGATFMQNPHGVGLTFSCATCHSADLFGTTVMGLTNKRPRANEFFATAKKYIPRIPSGFFQQATGASRGEREMFSRTKANLAPIGVKIPETLGLDTSLAQVALSLARRSPDDEATRDPYYQRYPRANAMDKHVADSKPMPWWNLKYKTRWLSDGSIVAGNPIYTNFLWNEIGRGTDLRELEEWLKNNQETVQELTAAAFATTAPHYWDFFPISEIKIEQAKRGQKHFRQACMQCHGDYIKGWESDRAHELSLEEYLQTAQVRYHEKTPVRDVGTDPGRYLGTQYFADRLNELKISQFMGTIVEPQVGYVPPPLEGIWARYPYLHNNAIPNLCALMTPPKNRPVTFYQGPAVDKERDFDRDCVGYPVGEAIPSEWKKERDALFDTRRTGMSNQGHYRMFLTDEGEERFSQHEKSELLEFLKTL